MLFCQQQLAFAKSIDHSILSPQLNKPQQIQITMANDKVTIQPTHLHLNDKSHKSIVHLPHYNIDGHSKDTDFQSDSILHRKINKRGKPKFVELSDRKSGKLTSTIKKKLKSKTIKIRRSINNVYDGPPPFYQAPQPNQWPWNQPTSVHLNTPRGPQHFGTIPINTQLNPHYQQQYY